MVRNEIQVVSERERERERERENNLGHFMYAWRLYNVLWNPWYYITGGNWYIEGCMLSARHPYVCIRRGAQNWLLFKIWYGFYNCGFRNLTIAQLFVSYAYCTKRNKEMIQVVTRDILMGPKKDKEHVDQMMWIVDKINQIVGI